MNVRIICVILLIMLVIPIGVALAVGPVEEPLEARIEKLEAEVVWLKTRDVQVRAAIMGIADIADKNTNLFAQRLKALEDVVFQGPLREGEHKG